MSGSIRNFLNRFLPPPTNVFLREQERMLAEIRALQEQLNAVTEDCGNAAEMQGTLFDEMTQHVRAAQTEVVENMDQQFQAAEMMRQEHTDRIAELTQEMEAVKAELAAQRKELAELRSLYVRD